jgi:predicted nucleic acid-binding protein
MRSVYLETTIPSTYFDTRPSMKGRREIARAWWKEHAGAFRLVTSAFVRDELAEAPEEKRHVALPLLERATVLPVPPRLAEVVATYLRHKVMPRGALGDAAHAAMCALHGIDVLLTWNCKHLANGNKMLQLRVLNDRLGVPTPMILTPGQLTAPRDPAS